MKELRNTLARYMFIFYPTWICLGRFIPFAGTLLTFCMIALLLSEQFLKKKVIVKYLAIIVLFVFSGCMYPSIENHTAHIKMMIIAFLALDASEGELYNNAIIIIEKSRKIIGAQLIIILLLNIVFMFIDAGYSIQYESLWRIRAYQGIFADPHQCAYHISALLIYLIVITKNEISPKHLLCMLGYEICVLRTGARVPTVFALVIGGVMCFSYMKTKVAKDSINTFLKYFFAVIIIIIGGYFIINYTTFGKKMLSSILRNDIDSGRGNMRVVDMQFFNESNWINKLLGHGTDALIDFHGNRPYGAYIWAHNDFTQILCGMGLIMFFFYCMTWFKVIKMSMKTSGWCVAITMLAIAVAFANGFYIHSRLVFVFPILLLFMEQNATKSKLSQT